MLSLLIKDDDNRNATKDLHAELGVLKLLPEHPNVVGLLGCCTRIEPLMIIVEYCTHGDLQGFLRSSRGISESYYKSKYHPIGRKMTSKMLLTFALQIAKGMSHLAAFKVYCRFLALTMKFEKSIISDSLTEKLSSTSDVLTLKVLFITILLFHPSPYTVSYYFFRRSSFED